jgi:hypothetical protein
MEAVPYSETTVNIYLTTRGHILILLLCDILRASLVVTLVLDVLRVYAADSGQGLLGSDGTVLLPAFMEMY